MIVVDDEYYPCFRMKIRSWPISRSRYVSSFYIDISFSFRKRLSRPILYLTSHTVDSLSSNVWLDLTGLDFSTLPLSLITPHYSSPISSIKGMLYAYEFVSVLVHAWFVIPFVRILEHGMCLASKYHYRYTYIHWLINIETVALLFGISSLLLTPSLSQHLIWFHLTWFDVTLRFTLYHSTPHQPHLPHLPPFTFFTSFFSCFFFDNASVEFLLTWDRRPPNRMLKLKKRVLLPYCGSRRRP